MGGKNDRDDKKLYEPNHKNRMKKRQSNPLQPAEAKAGDNRLRRPPTAPFHRPPNKHQQPQRPRTVLHPHHPVSQHPQSPM
ncbi:hypothetical protein PGTUg99_022051 [Puccinia graminis f. sp. tritici]|uniref:Uncharacterized protein n=1 Tax=Puccinia graminis f. sp. tritici TaxID=56615 RepID=A0A5B0RKZ6_PUCGR|nr:hypothetical protein PGTUg99_022051 [Puccinia graminis f. sp. tritici]